MPRIEWFAYSYPGRRSDRPVVEISLRFLPADLRHARMDIAPIKQCLEHAGILAPGETFPAEPLPGDFTGWYASLLAQTALLLQQKTGHRVGHSAVLGEPDNAERIALVEHEHCDVGLTSVKLAAELLTGKRRLLAEPFKTFSAFAAERLLPVDTGAIIAAARRRGIPTTKLERNPYTRERFDGLTGGHCIRRNGLLMLGHGAHQQVLDGLFCLTVSGDLKHLVGDAVDRRGFPADAGLLSADPAGAGDVAAAAHQYLLINGQLVATKPLADGSWSEPATPGSALHERLLRVAQAVGFAPLAVTVGVDGAVVDFDLAPQIDGAGQGALMERVADLLLDWLFGDADGEHTRMPIIAVTGTNGKTTTARMVREIVAQAGRRPGLVCTDGIYLGDEQVAGEDRGAVGGHLEVLTSKAVDTAVLETHHAGILNKGFAFDECEVAICTTVANDHLGPQTVASVEEMGLVKGALLERARDAAVLNADNEYCLNMVERLRARKVCLVSTRLSAGELQDLGPAARTCCCVLERVDGQDWVVIYDGARIPVVPVAAVPATFGGRAAFNVSNAMHAIAGCYFLGHGMDVIRAAMERFRMDFDTAPGRLNFYDAYPFGVLMDAVKNPAGAEALVRFIGKLEVSGKKYLMLQARGDRDDGFIKAMGTALAGCFDHYVCQAHSVYPGEPHDRAPRLVKEALLEAGVGEEQVTLKDDLAEAVNTLLRMGSEGDLLVFAPGTGSPKSLVWEQVLAFGDAAQG